MVWRVLDRPTAYRILGVFCLSVGMTLACLVSTHFAREELVTLVEQDSGYLLVASTPVFVLPPATPLPTFTPTSTPTATPEPLPAIRLSIPAISLNTHIQETFPVTRTSWTGERKLIWEPVAFAVGHYDSSGYPGEGTNIVLAGHNNTQGAVFRRLSELNPGDEVILYTADDEFHYQVQETIVVPYRGTETEGDVKLQSYAAPKPAETVTLISCWPYATNADRIVVIAVPVSEEKEYAQ
jgi:sortase A